MDTTTDDMRTAELRREIAERREGIGRDLEVIGDRVSPGRMVDRTRERTRRRATGLRDRLMGPVDSARTSFADSSGSHSIGERVGEMASGLTDHDPAGAVTHRVEGSPMAMGLVAFGIGFIAGSVIPPSRSERELAQRVEPQVSQLAQGAARSAREAGEHLAPIAKDEADQLKEEASAAAAHVADAGKQEAAAARDEVRPSSS